MKKHLFLFCISYACITTCTVNPFKEKLVTKIKCMQLRKNTPKQVQRRREDAYTFFNKGHFDLVKMLHMPGEVHCAIRNDDETLLHRAAERANVQMVGWLLEQGYNPNTYNITGRSPLHKAVMAQSLASVQLLLAHEARYNEQDTFGRTPLHLTSIYNRKDEQMCTMVAIQEALINAGADIHIKDKYGKPCIKLIT